MRFGISLTLLAAACGAVMALEAPQGGSCSSGQLACCDGSSSNGQIDGWSCQAVDNVQDCFATLACCPAESGQIVEGACVTNA
ncbi:hypothetical protein N7523_000866 [Penicillium sp. IBT 18751x]|nr:hypothetical protein N7523_000866 [Penicillium sp. IBT 18751x]